MISKLPSRRDVSEFLKLAGLSFVVLAILAMLLLPYLVGCRSSGIFINTGTNAKVVLTISDSDVKATQDAGKTTDIAPETTLPIR